MPVPRRRTMNSARPNLSQPNCTTGVSISPSCCRNWLRAAWLKCRSKRGRSSAVPCCKMAWSMNCCCMSRRCCSATRRGRCSLCPRSPPCLTRGAGRSSIGACSATTNEFYIGSKMFSGIVQSVGSVAQIERRGGDVRLTIVARDFALDEVKLGDSIAVAGVCLTVVKIDAAQLAFDVSVETLNCTTLGALRPGAGVNLEKALRLADRLDGHLVSGHVDGVGRVVAIESEARSQRWTFEAPPALAKYIATKGSIAIDGTSLTVNEVDGARFGVNLIPHTIAVTTFQDRRVGDAVNLEVDMIARYVERLLRG